MELVDEIAQIELKKFKIFCRKMEHVHYRDLSPVAAFKTRYANLSLTPLDLYSAEFDDNIGMAAGLLPATTDIDLGSPAECLLGRSYGDIEAAAISFLGSQRPDNVPMGKLRSFVQAVFREYKFVPYHNFAHGVSVMQFFHFFVRSLPDPSTLFDQTHIFVSLVASLAHDVGHPGKNNAYNCIKKTKLALKSFNKAVLEKLHVKKTLYLLKQQENNIFCNFSEAETSKANQLIIEAILATDMADHFNLVDRFAKTKTADFKKNDNFLTGYVVHAGDLGNLCLDYNSYAGWAKLIVQEFQSQTECEKRYQLKESEFMKFKGRESFAKDQLFFASGLIRHLRPAAVQVN